MATTRIISLTGFFIFGMLLSQEVCKCSEDSVRESLRNLLGLGQDFGEKGLRVKSEAMPSKYMMDLYEKYRSGQIAMQGNIVRSILPITEIIDTTNTLLFNLTGINVNERILQSKLFLLKKGESKYRNKITSLELRIKVFNVPDMIPLQYINVSRAPTSQWNSYDISYSIRRCRPTHRLGESLLGLTLETKRQNGSYRLVPFRRFLKKISKSFILLFSDEGTTTSSEKSRNKRSGLKNQNGLSIKHIDNIDSTPTIFNSTTNSFSQRYKRGTVAKEKNVSKNFSRETKDNIHLSFNKCKHLQTLHKLFNTNITFHEDIIDKYFKLLFDAVLSDSFHFDIFEKFKLLCSSNMFHSFFDGHVNSYLDIICKSIVLSNINCPSSIYSLQFAEYNATSESTPLRTQRSISDKESSSKNSSLTSSSNQQNDSRSFPKEHGIVKRNNRLRDRLSKRKKLKKSQKAKLPKWWTHQINANQTMSSNKICRRRSLVIDFMKLGWGDWVLSPRSFNAYFCAGGCSYPFIKNMRPSNHAAIQSLVHAIGLHREVPQPSCVPVATRNLTLLYVDQHNNLVLKNFPDMIVKKCACR